jgi:D-arginine dehydrogenase
MARFDVLIVGGGIAGTSLGAGLAGKLRTAIIEAEAHCGMHATGRSAAFWLESYGGPNVAVLSAASHDFLQRPPGDFSPRVERFTLHATGFRNCHRAFPRA